MMNNWYFMGTMIILLLVLIGVLLYLRNQREEE